MFTAKSAEKGMIKIIGNVLENINNIIEDLKKGIILEHILVVLI